MSNHEGFTDEEQAWFNSGEQAPKPFDAKAQVEENRRQGSEQEVQRAMDDLQWKADLAEALSSDDTVLGNAVKDAMKRVEAAKAYATELHPDKDYRDDKGYIAAKGVWNEAREKFMAAAKKPDTIKAPSVSPDDQPPLMSA